MELFVTDLDGTLLNSKKEVSKYSCETLNNLIDKGVNFTVATARTPATVAELLEGLNLKLPVALMNGVLIYDIKEERYIDVKEINTDLVIKCLDVFEKQDKNVLVYGIKDNHLWVYYKEFKNDWEYDFYKERADKKLKTFVQITDYKEAIKGSKIINFVAFDKYENIKNINDELSQFDGLTVNFYEDIYEEDCYFLEAYSNEASKANGIKFLERYIEHDNLVCFGDNLNDIPMFELANEAYATANAVDKLKEMSTAVINSCDEDGVARFLAERFNK